MRLLSPITDLTSAIAQIEAGAKEIYFAGDCEVFAHLNFSGRGKYGPKGNQTFVTDHELKEIIHYAHSKDVSTQIAMNMPFYYEASSGDKSVSEELEKRIKFAVDCGVDYIIAGDIGIVSKLQKYRIPVVISSFFDVVNSQQIEFLCSFENVKRIVLSYQVTLDEILYFSQKFKNVEFEIFGHFGCSFYDGLCNFKHFFGEGHFDRSPIPCMMKYSLQDGKNEICNGQLFNYALVCSLCSIFDFIQNNVYSLKLVGRSGNLEDNCQLTKQYWEAINLAVNCDTRSEYVEKLFQGRHKWWKKALCDKKSCKYISKDVIPYFISNKMGEDSSCL